MGFWEWAASVDWGALAIDVLIPVLAILVPTLIAVKLARTERENAIADRREERELAVQDRQKERRLEAGSDVIVALAPLASAHANHPMQQHLWDLRARIAVYRAWIDPDDRSGDWLALRHREGMRLWQDALGTIEVIGGPQAINDDGMFELLRPAHEWAAMTSEMFTGFLSGHVDADALLRDGARILKKYPRDTDGKVPGSSEADVE